ncbi:MAG: hypothetical protein WED05_05115 [Candidatus Atabeyarchaeum deiterrae]|jgi:hypothetical protein
MCEFSVYDVNDPSKKIAEDIVRATIRDGSLVASKVLGESLALDNTIILDVDVSRERMLVSRSPLVKNIFKLTELTSDFKKNPSIKLQSEISVLWEQTKSEGDSLMKSMKIKK